MKRDPKPKFGRGRDMGGRLFDLGCGQKDLIHVVYEAVHDTERVNGPANTDSSSIKVCNRHSGSELLRVIARDLIGSGKTNIYDALGLARRVIYRRHHSAALLGIPSPLDEANRNNYVALPCTAGYYSLRVR